MDHADKGLVCFTEQFNKILVGNTAFNYPEKPVKRTVGGNYTVVDIKADYRVGNALLYVLKVIFHAEYLIKEGRVLEGH